MLRGVLYATLILLPTWVGAQTVTNNFQTPQDITPQNLQQDFEDIANQIRKSNSIINTIQTSTSGAAGLSLNNKFTGTNQFTSTATFVVPTVPIFISSQDVVSFATVTFSVPAASTNFRFDYNVVSTAAFSVRFLAAGDSSPVYSMALYGMNSNGVAYSMSGTTHRGCSPDGPNQVSAKGAVEGSFVYSYPVYGGTPKSARLNGLSGTYQEDGSPAYEAPFHCVYAGTGTPSTISVTISQTNTLTSPAGANNLINGHFELWQIGSTHP